MIYINIADLSRDNVAELANEVEIKIEGWGSAYTDENSNILAEVIRTTTSLEELRFDNRTALQNDKVVDALAKNRTIKALDFEYTFCGDDGAKAVAAILKENSTIEELTLYNNNISGEGAKAIAEALKKNTSLQKLFLSGNQIRIRGATAIAAALKENHSLQKLYIGGSNIGDQGAKAIAEALKENTSLQDLSIQDNNISEEGGKHILNALQQIDTSAIEYIDLLLNQISKETHKKIKQEMIRINKRFKSVGSNVGQVVAVETAEDRGIQDDENPSSSSNDQGVVLTTIHATDASQGSAEIIEASNFLAQWRSKSPSLSEGETNETGHDITAMGTKMRELQSTIVQQQGKIAEQDEAVAHRDKKIAQLHNELALKQEETASLTLRIQRLNGLDAGSDDLENYTKCCVCLEPYEEEQNSSGNQRLPIKSATCAHSLCEDCLGRYHASLMNGRPTLRYMRCPQCNDKTKKAFDIQNKVVDVFVRDYIQCRKRQRSAL